MAAHRCRLCGSFNVQTVSWIDPNHETIQDHFGSPGEMDTEWCADCEKHGTVEYVEDLTAPGTWTPDCEKDARELATERVEAMTVEEVYALAVEALIADYRDDQDRFETDRAELASERWDRHHADVETRPQG